MIDRESLAVLLRELETLRDAGLLTAYGARLAAELKRVGVATAEVAFLASSFDAAAHELVSVQEPGAEPVCVFCGKSKKQARIMVQGPLAGICDECVDICAEIIREKAGPEAP